MDAVPDVLEVRCESADNLVPDIADGLQGEVPLWRSAGNLRWLVNVSSCCTPYQYRGMNHSYARAITFNIHLYEFLSYAPQPSFTELVEGSEHKPAAGRYDHTDRRLHDN